MDKRMRFFAWLIGQLERRRMTYEEIAAAWLEAAANAQGKSLEKRTFHRHRDEIEQMFGIKVECSGRSGGYRYYLKKDSVKCDDVTEWLLSSLRLASLGDMLQYHTKVMLDPAPRNSGLLDDILRAIDKQYRLRFDYTTAYGVETSVALTPAFVRFFKQRWYVIGVNEKEQVRCLPFDRISLMYEECTKRPLSPKLKQMLTPDNYYDGCFGIMRMEDEPIENVRLRVFYPEYNYLEEVPLHESQQKVGQSADGLYREYTLRVRPTRDFLQELLWHGRNLMVLKPESLRQKMIAILQDMTKSYETGECTNGE